MSGGAPSGRGGLFAVLLPTLECNLACAYCFEARRRGRWTIGEARRVLSQAVLLAADQGFGELRIHWQGGEPLRMGESFWGEVLPMAEAVASDAGVALDQRMQTNLTLFDGWLAPLARRHLGGRLGTSYDGTGERRTPHGGAAEFERAFWRGFREATDAGLEIGALATLRPALLEEGAAAYLDRLHSLGIRRLRVTLPFEAPGGRGGWLDAGAAGRFLAEAYRRWTARGRDGWIQLKPFSFLERRLAGLEPQESGLCTFSESCADGAIAVDPKGDVWLCDSWLGRGRPWGNALGEELAAVWRGPARAAARRACASLVDDACLACRWLPVCQGGCLVRARARPGGAGDHYCDSYRALFEAIASTLTVAR